MTPQEKLIYTAEKMGVPISSLQQGSTRVLYDSLPLPAVSGGQIAGGSLKFFENVGQRVFPFSNLDDNKLAVGEAVVAERIGFGYSVESLGEGFANGQNLGVIFPFEEPCIFRPDPSVSPGWVSESLDQINKAQYSMNIASSEVLKRILMATARSSFNKDSQNSDMEASPFLHLTADVPEGTSHFSTAIVSKRGRTVKLLDTLIVIPPQLQFTVDLRFPTLQNLSFPDGTQIRMHVFIEGMGTLLNANSY